MLHLLVQRDIMELYISLCFAVQYLRGTGMNYMKKMKKQELYSIPNCMGYFRILLIPLFCFLYLNAEDRSDYYLAAGVILVSYITDFLDGQVARRFHMITEFGKLLDPVADKLTHGAIALCLAFRYEAMRYLLVLMVLKEGFMAVMGVINLRHGRKLDGAKWFGKFCTGALFILLFLLVLWPGIPLVLADGLIDVVTVIMFLTLCLYIPEFRKMIRSWDREQVVKK